jgi:hypothetical protein
MISGIGPDEIEDGQQEQCYYFFGIGIYIYDIYIY